jgi:hypothetical protein
MEIHVKTRYRPVISGLLKTNVINAKLKPQFCACPEGMPKLSKSTNLSFAIAISKICAFEDGRGSLMAYLRIALKIVFRINPAI